MDTTLPEQEAPIQETKKRKVEAKKPEPPSNQEVTTKKKRKTKVKQLDGANQR